MTWTGYDNFSRMHGRCVYFYDDDDDDDDDDGDDDDDDNGGGVSYRGPFHKHGIMFNPSMDK